MTNNEPDYNDNLYFEKLQKNENVANNVANEKSQDLTEQWKKGQLEGFRWYYVKFKTGEIDICWLTEWSNNELGTGGQYFDGIKEENILEVLAPVLSYEELQSMNESVNQAMVANIKLVDDNKRLKHDVGNLGYKIKNQRHEINNRLKEIAKLKYILNEWVQFEVEENPNDYTVMSDLMKELSLKTKEVLK